MPHAFRHLCIGLCVAVLAAMNLHGLSESQHALGHAIAWPAAALVEAGDDHHGVHVHVAPDEAPETDADRNGEGPVPVGHHHHGGGDVHAAMPGAGRVLNAASPGASALQPPGADPAMSSLAGDGPEHPPKWMPTVV